MEQHMAARIAEGRAALARECIAALPDDVLRCLFDAAVEDDPVAVAAVCSRWRRVALACPALWSNICVPIPPAPSAGTGTGLCERFVTAHLQRVNTFLERSRSSPVDIRIPWAGWKSKGNAYIHCQQLFCSFASHVARWRAITIGIPDGFGRGILDCLRGPTPLLAELTITVITDGNSFDDHQNGYLPYAPRLRKLALWDLGMGCAKSSNFRCLTDLTLIRAACTDEQLYEFLRQAGETLRNINLETAVARAPAVELRLPRLRSLHIAHSSSLIASPLLVLPSLTLLSLLPSYHDPRDPLAGLALSDRLVPFLEAVSATVNILYLGYPINDGCLSIVARLKSIQQLHPFPQTATIDFKEAALARLASSTPPIWPRLSRISRLGCAAGDGSYEGTLQLLTTRNTTEGRAAFEESVRPCKLVQVDLEKSAPEWLGAEVKRLLAL